MTFKFWSLNFSGRGNTLFERYVNLFKDSLNSDPKIQQMLTHHFLPDAKGKRPSEFGKKRVISFQENLKFYPQIAGKSADYVYDIMNFSQPGLSIIPSELTPQKSIRLTFKEKISLSNAADKTQLDVNIDTAPLFFYFMNAQHRCLLMLLVEFEDNSKSICQFSELSFSEEQFRQILLSGMPLSLKIPRPATASRIKLTVFDPFSFTCGIESLAIPR